MNIIINQSCFNISSNNSKMGKVHSFSVSPVKTCRCDAPCKKDCYAVNLCKRYKNVRLSYENNMNCILNEKKKDIIEKICLYIKLYDVSLFRWNVAGDFNLKNYFDITLAVAKKCPKCKFLAFTKMYEVTKDVKLPKNYNIVYSCWEDLKIKNARKYPCAYLDNGKYTIPKYATSCDGGCDKCMKCWNLKPGQAVKFKKHK